MTPAPMPRARRAEIGDPELLSMVSRGDVSALGALYDRHDQALRRVILRLGVTRTDADDLVQETFLEVARCAEKYDGRADARPWLIGLSLNVVRRHRRSLRILLRNFVAWASEPAPATVTPEEDAEGASAARRARAALDALSPKKREVFTLVVLEGLPGEQVAALLQIPVATVWTRLHHARRELRAAISPEAP